tara:strand:+ start:5742 stop:6977 length:1236 start_codon:yes stop_codon:yes gene_type:complete
MLSVKLKPEQIKAANALVSRDATILVANTGFGKTLVCLTALKSRMLEKKTKVLVACPPKVMDVWKKEAAKWGHTKDLKVQVLRGTPEARAKRLLEKADIVVISLNSLDWLLKERHGCNAIIIDEISKATGKQGAGLRSKKKADRFKWRVGMTATPVSQDFEKLYSMCRIIDGGKALGRSKDRFLNEYFISDYMGYKWELRKGAAEAITDRVAGLVHAVTDKKSDELPPITYHLKSFAMPTKTRIIYNKMRKEMVAGGVVAVNDAVKSGKLRQIASGFLYQEEDVIILDDARRAAVKAWTRNLKGRPGLIFYEFTQQFTWVERGKCHWAQINSMSHGIDGLQHVYADVLFVQPIWSRDAYLQAVGRVWRTGQTKPVNVTTLVCQDSLDELVIDRVEDKAEYMTKFMKHLKAD